jgi:hypothetical protein
VHRASARSARRSSMPSEADQKTPCMPTRLGLPPTRRPCPRPSQSIGGKRDERVLLLRRRTCSMSGTAGLPRVGRARSRPLRPPASPGEGAISADRDDATVLHREEPRPQGDCLRRKAVTSAGQTAVGPRRTGAARGDVAYVSLRFCTPCMRPAFGEDRDSTAAAAAPGGAVVAVTGGNEWFPAGLIGGTPAEPASRVRPEGCVSAVDRGPLPPLGDTR